MAIEKNDMTISAIGSYANVTDKNQNARKFLRAAQNSSGSHKSNWFHRRSSKQKFNVRSPILHTLITACAQRYSQREFWHKIAPRERAKNQRMRRDSLKRIVNSLERREGFAEEFLASTESRPHDDARGLIIWAASSNDL